MEAPQTSRIGDDYAYLWPQRNLQITLRGIREHAGELSGMVFVTHLNGTASVLAPSRLNLGAPRSRTELAGRLAGCREPKLSKEDWNTCIELVCDWTYHAHEKGEPVVDLAQHTPAAGGGRWLVEPLLRRGEMNVLVADGGTGKSTLAGALAFSVMTGVPLWNGAPPTEARRALYLDWESTPDEHAPRLAALAAGYDVETPSLLYRSNYRALADDAAWLRRTVAENEIGFVVVDSAVPASDDEINDTRAPRQLHSALRSLGPDVTPLVLAHMTKADAEKSTGRAKMLGSGMYDNLARNIWEVRKSEMAGEQHVLGLFHRKGNNSQLRRPFALSIEYGGSDCLPRSVHLAELRRYSDLAERLPAYDRLTDILRSGDSTTVEIADRLGLTQREAVRLLERNEQVRQTYRGGGRGNPSRWGLAAGNWWND